MSRDIVRKILKLLSFGSLAVIVCVLMVATVIEKIHGTELVFSKIYTSWWMITLWTVMTLSTLLYLKNWGIHRRWKILFVHISLAVILLGALTSHLTGRDGALHLRVGESTTDFYLRGGDMDKFDFTLTLNDFELKFYEGTSAPMDYVSHISILDNSGTTRGKVSMNNIVRYGGYRLYQSGYDPDCEGATLLVAYDPYGIAITYLGYALLLLSFIIFFFERNSMFRTLIKNPLLRNVTVVALLMTSTLPAEASERPLPRTLTPEAASSFAELCVYYNDRIAPLQTLARDFTAKLYGKTEYRGLTAEQVLLGWFFYYDDWKSEPIIKLKGDDVRRALGVEGSYATLEDYVDIEGYKLEPALRSSTTASKANIEAAHEKYQLVRMLCMGTLLKIYPHTDPATGDTVWYSMADELPTTMSPEEALFVRKSMALVAASVLKSDESSACEVVRGIAAYQRESAENMPSRSRLNVERLYNNIGYNRPLAMFCLTLGILSFLVLCTLRHGESRVRRVLHWVLYVVMVLLLLYLTLHIALRGYVSGHIPLANGYETMQFMSWCSVVLTLVMARRFRLALPFGLLIAGFTLLVAMLGEASPRITQLMPVLQSPLLSIHVMVIMLSYTLLAFIMLNGVTAVMLRLLRRDNKEIEYLYVVSRVMLYPAVMLLAIGIFIGAVWANVSWGRYWGWDPKEVWALVTMLIYAAMIHTTSLEKLRRPMLFHVLAIVAFLAVLVTYFGVNFVLGGMHSYA